MAEINAPEVEEQAGFFETEQIDNFIMGLNTAGAGAKQAYIEAQEAMGLIPKGSSLAETQDLQGDLDVLRSTISNEQRGSGAKFVEFGGEALPLFAVPFGSSVRGAAALGGLSSSAFFQEDVTESRFDDILLGAGIGGGTKKLLQLLTKGGPAREGASRALALFQDKAMAIRPKQGGGSLVPTGGQSKALVPAPQRGAQQPQPQLANQQRQLTNQTIDGGRAQVVEDGLLPGGFIGQKKLPPPGPTARGMSADDFAGAAGSRTQGTRGAGTSELGQTAVQRSMARIKDSAKFSTEMVNNAIKKAEAFSKRAGERADTLKKSLAIKKKGLTGSKASREAQTKAIRNAMNKANREALSSSVMAKAIRASRGVTTPRSPVSKGVARAEQNVPQEATQSVSGVHPDEVQRVLDHGTKADMKQMMQKLDPENLMPMSMTKAQMSDILQATKKNKFGGPGGKQAGVAQSDVVNFAGGAVAGGALGGAISDGDPATIAAFALGGGVGLRALGKNADKIVTNKAREGMRKASRDGGKFRDDMSRATKLKDYTKETVADVLTKGAKAADSFLGSMMTRLELVAPRVAVALKESEYAQHRMSGKWMEEAEQSFKTIDDADLSDEQSRRLKRLMLNSTKNGEAYLRSLGKTDAANAVVDMRRMLDDIGVYLGGADLGGSLRKNYFPRMVTDPKFFEGIEEVNNHLEMLAKKKGIDLTDFEKEQAITDLMNGALSQAGKETKWGRASENLQRRTQKVTDGSSDAYADLKQGMGNYIDNITTQVERRKFFKGQGVRTDDLGANAENIDSVAVRLKNELMKKGGNTEGVDEAVRLIAMRYGPGEQAPHRAVQHFKNLTYAGLLGNPLAAITQFGDLALSAHKNGIINTVKAVAEAASGKGKINGLDKDTLLGIKNAATDFGSKVGTREVLDWSLKHSGFRWTDELGKNTFLQASMMKAQQMDKADFTAKWKNIFDPDSPAGGPTPRTDKLFNDVRNFKGITPENREDVGFMMWNNLNEAQPISLSSMPEQYLKNPNGRMAYMLQSFTLKMFDVMRKDIFQKLADPATRGEGMKNAAKFSSLFVLMNGGTDAAKNFLMGKDEAVTDVMVNNFFKLAGFNKFTVDTAGREGLGKAITGLVLPPTALIDAGTNLKKAQSLIPVIGRPSTSEIFQ